MFDWEIIYYRSVSLKGNTYFVAREELKDAAKTKAPGFLLCFDVTAERFGTVTISCVRDEQIAVLYIDYDMMMEIWIKTKIDPNVVSWSKFLTVDMRPLTGCPANFYVGSFFIEEEKKVSVVSYKPTETCCYQKACIIGEDGYL